MDAEAFRYEHARTRRLRRPALEKIAAVVNGNGVVRAPGDGRDLCDGRDGQFRRYPRESHDAARKKGNLAADIVMHNLPRSTAMRRYMHATLSTIWTYSLLFLAQTETASFGEELQMQFLVLARRIQSAASERDRHDGVVSFDFEVRMRSWLLPFLLHADDDLISLEFLMHGGARTIPYTSVRSGKSIRSLFNGFLCGM